MLAILYYLMMIAMCSWSGMIASIIALDEGYFIVFVLFNIIIAPLCIFQVWVIFGFLIYNVTLPDVPFREFGPLNRLDICFAFCIPLILCMYCYVVIIHKFWRK